MFKEGDLVVCIDDRMGTIPCLSIKVGGVYTVKEYLSLEEYEKLHPDSG